MIRAAAPADPFKALADPNRRKILELLAKRERTVGDLTSLLGIAQASVSQHMQILRGAGLLSERSLGRRTYYRPRGEGLQPIINWVARYEAFWSNRLDALATHLAKKASTEEKK